MKKVPASVAKAATDKPTLSAKPDTADKTVDDAAKDKEAPSTTEQPTKAPEPKAQRAGSTAETADQKADELPVEQSAAYAAGREAKRHGIDRLDAPFGDGDDKDAWLKGYDFEPDQI